MAQNKCPLCGGRLLHGECVSCGFRLPNEDTLSAPYNLDPDDDVPDAYEPAPEKYQMPEAKPETYERYGGNAAPVKERTAAPNIKVMPTQNMAPAPQNNNQQGWQNPYGGRPVQQNNPNNQPQNQQGWQNPYNYNPTQNKTRNPVNPTSSQNGGKGILAVLIVLLVLSFISPLFGVVGLIVNNNIGTSVGAKTKSVFKVLFIVSTLISFWGLR